MLFILQNTGRIMRGLFEITFHRGWPAMAARMLTLCKCMDHRQWGFEHPLRQFGRLPSELVDKLEARKTPLDRLKDMSADEIGGASGSGSWSRWPLAVHVYHVSYCKFHDEYSKHHVIEPSCD